MLGEASTKEIAKVENPQGFEKNKKVSKRGRKIAGDASMQLEKETGKKVVNHDNHLPIQKKRIRK